MTITMAHGSGGAETSRLIRDVFASRFGNKLLEPMEDAAILKVSGRIAYTTDSYVVTPLIFPGGDIGRLAVCGTVNDLAVMGAKPLALTAGFILEEGLPLNVLERVADSMASAAREAHVQIVAGDTKVISGAGGMYINTSGIGLVNGRGVRIADGRVGDAVVVSGQLGDHHACILSRRMGVENNIQSDAQPLWSFVNKLQKTNIPIHGMRDITRGGLATVLNELSEACNLGVTLDEALLPVSSEVRGFCDMLGLEPLYMGNEGKLVAIIPSEYAHQALAIMKKHPYGKNAAIVGTLTDGKGVHLRTPLGGLRIVNALQGEGLPRIC